MQYISQSQVFQKLKENIARLKMQKQQVTRQMSNDRSDLQNIQSSILQLTRQTQQKLNYIKQKQRKLAELQKTIAQTEKSYEIIIQTTQKLSNALQYQSSNLKSRIRK